LLVVDYCWNDHWAGSHDLADKDQQLPAQWVLDVQNALGRTLTYRWLKYIIFSIRKQEAEFSHTQPVYRVGPADYHENIGGIIATARTRNIPVILLTSPIPSLKDFPPANVHLFHEKYNEITRSFAGTSGVAMLDIAAEFAESGGLYNDPGYDPIHYNVNGHKIIARRIAEYITKSTEKN